MPRYDGSGPCGMGPATGRGRGGCNTRGILNRLEKIGYGMGRGRCGR